MKKNENVKKRKKGPATCKAQDKQQLRKQKKKLEKRRNAINQGKEKRRKK